MWNWGENYKAQNAPPEGKRMKLDFRPAQPEDIEPLFTFNRELIDAYEDKSLIDYGRVLAWVRRKLEQRLDEYTCVWAGGQKAGYFHFYPLDGKVMELDDLYLFPAFRGRGIGTEIIRACCRAAAGRPVVLYVFVPKHPGRRPLPPPGLLRRRAAQPHPVYHAAGGRHALTARSRSVILNTYQQNV